MISFVKMQALGNDFVIIDARQQIFIPCPQNIQKWADRHLGIGYDQLLLLKKDTHADLLMEIYNADGSQATACGNGARCVAWLWMQQEHKQKMTLKVAERTLHAWKKSNNIISVDMGFPEFNTDLSLKISNDLNLNALFVSLGNPHLVIQNNHFSQEKLEKIVQSVHNSSFFPQGVNIEFFSVLDSHHISLKIFERGVGPTKACGSGACAAAIATILQKKCQSDIIVSMENGYVTISYLHNVILTGEVSFVFEGKIDYISTCIDKK